MLTYCILFATMVLEPNEKKCKSTGTINNLRHEYWSWMARTGEMNMQTQLDQLLERTSGSHGFWLINHVEYIKDDLDELLNQYGGIHTAVKKLNDIHSDYVKSLYTKIEKAKRLTA